MQQHNLCERFTPYLLAFCKSRVIQNKFIQQNCFSTIKQVSEVLTNTYYKSVYEKCKKK